MGNSFYNLKVDAASLNGFVLANDNYIWSNPAPVVVLGTNTVVNTSHVVNVSTSDILFVAHNVDAVKGVGSGNVIAKYVHLGSASIYTIAGGTGKLMTEYVLSGNNFNRKFVDVLFCTFGGTLELNLEMTSFGSNLTIPANGFEYQFIHFKKGI